MKKVLYTLPAAILCLFMGFLGLVFGFRTVTSFAWGYLFFSMLGSMLLWNNKWWGGLVGAITGCLILWHEYMSDGHAVVVSAVPLGIEFLVYYLLMALLCLKTQART